MQVSFSLNLVFSLPFYMFFRDWVGSANFGGPPSVTMMWYHVDITITFTFQLFFLWLVRSLPDSIGWKWLACSAQPLCKIEKRRVFPRNIVHSGEEPQCSESEFPAILVMFAYVLSHYSSSEVKEM